MKPEALREIYESAWREYRMLGSRQEKSQFLDCLTKLTSQNRDNVVKYLNRSSPPSFKKDRGHKEKIYTPELIEQVRKLYRRMGPMGAEKFRAALPDWLPHYDDPKCTYEMREKLLKIGLTTTKKILKQMRMEEGQKGLAGTRRSKALVMEIPLCPGRQGVDGPGHLQVDSVAHCGDSLEGQFVWTVTVTDIVTGWTEAFGVWHKDVKQIVDGLLQVEQNAPFRVKSWRFDNGTEFINHSIHNEFIGRRRLEERVKLFRARPYKKNDQCFVEQKNFEHVRKLLGYQRFDDKNILPLMNCLYKRYWNPLNNNFIPQKMLSSKKREGARIVKRHDVPATPFDRVVAQLKAKSPELERLLQERLHANPFELRSKAYSLVKKIHNLALTSEPTFEKGRAS